MKTYALKLKLADGYECELPAPEGDEWKEVDRLKVIEGEIGVVGVSSYKDSAGFAAAVDLRKKDLVVGTYAMRHESGVNWLHDMKGPLKPGVSPRGEKNALVTEIVTYEKD